jgi:hypothetical protein
MRAKININPITMDIDKLSVLIERLNELGVYHDGEIICDSNMDNQVVNIIVDSILNDK